MNETLNEETVEELNEYTLTFENSNSTNEELNNNESSLNEEDKNLDASQDELSNDTLNDEDLERAEECTALVTVKERRLMAAQTMFKKSIKISIKSFLISLSLSFLNLFI